MDEHLNIIIVHVDMGRSTMGGNLRYLGGTIGKHTIENQEKYECEVKAAGRETWYDAAGAVQELYFTPNQGQGAFTRSRCTWCWTIDCYVRHRGECRQGLLRDGPGRTAVHGPGCAGAQDACVINDLGYGGGGWHCSSPLHARASSRKAPGRAGRRMSTSRLSLIIECIPRLQRCLAPGASRSA